MFYGTFEKILYKYYENTDDTSKEFFSEILLSAGLEENDRHLLFNASDAVFSKFRSGSLDIYDKILRCYKRPDIRELVAPYFQDNFTNHIGVERVANLLRDFTDLIFSDLDIAYDQKKNFEKLANPEMLNDFLSEVFIYAIKQKSKSKRDIKFSFDNPPFKKNDFFIGRRDEIKEIHDNFHKGIRIQTISGMSGTGKTQIALEYAYYFAGEYDVICWMDADNSDTMRNSVKSFLRGRNCSLKNEGAEFECDAFLNWFNNASESWLLIYDNAVYVTKNECEELQKYMPKNNKAGNILLTTICDEPYDDEPLINIDVFAEHTAKEFLYRRTKIVDDKGAADLAERLGYLPLALEQAGAHISKEKINYAEYLSLLEKHGLKIFGDEYTKKVKHYKYTLLTTWAISIEKIELSMSAKHLLGLCSYFSPDAIDFSLFVEEAESLKTAFEIIEKGEGLKLENEKLINLLEGALNEESSFIIKNKIPYFISNDLIKILNNELDRNKLIQDLVEYSLIKYDNGMIYIHRLLQEIIRERIGNSYDHIKFCLQLLDLINSRMLGNRNFEYLIRNIPHIMSIMHHASLILKDYEFGHLSIIKDTMFNFAEICMKYVDRDLMTKLFTLSLSYCHEEYYKQKDHFDDINIIESMCKKLEAVFSKSVFWPEKYGTKPVEFNASFRITEDTLSVELKPQKPNAHSIILITSSNEQEAFDIINGYNE